MYLFQYLEQFTNLSFFYREKYLNWKSEKIQADPDPEVAQEEDQMEEEGLQQDLPGDRGQDQGLKNLGLDPGQGPGLDRETGMTQDPSLVLEIDLDQDPDPLRGEVDLALAQDPGLNPSKEWRQESSNDKEALKTRHDNWHYFEFRF